MSKFNFLNTNSEIKKVLIIITGSIACYKTCDLISKLAKEKIEVKVVVTSSALQFIGKVTLEGLSGNPVYSDLWQEGQAMSHIELERWADLIAVVPATANFLNKIAAGQCDDLASTIFMTHEFKKPFLVSPAMNQAMLSHPITQKSITTLSELGLEVLPTEEGLLACGESGSGRLLNIEVIFSRIISHLFANKYKEKILITSGGTQEPIDDVRLITNKSTGRTASEIADGLIKLGFNVTFLHGKNSQLPGMGCENIEFNSFNDLHSKVINILSENKYSAVIHAAAVGDFSLQNGAHKGKFPSSDDLNLKFIKNPKIINELKKYCPVVIAFKLSSTTDEIENNQKISLLFAESFADLIIQNSVSETGWTGQERKFHWCEPNKNFVENETINSTNDLSEKISKFILEKIPNDLSS